MLFVYVFLLENYGEEAGNTLDDVSTPTMLVSCHLPITDLRPLLKGNNGKLSRPEWPAPSQREAFVRGFGRIRVRDLGGDAFFGGGSKVCKADGVLRFTSSDPEVVLSGDRHLKIDCEFRRFFLFRELAGKFEFGFSEKPQRGLSNEPVAIDSFWRGLLDLPINIRPLHPPHPTPAKNKSALNAREPRLPVASTLGLCGSKLAQAYLYASTSSRDGLKTEDWWVRSSPPVFFTEFNKEEPWSLPRHAQRLECSDSDVDVYKYVMDAVANVQTVNYIIRRNNHNRARAKSRALRVALSGQYSYISSIFQLLDGLGPDRISPVDGTEHASQIKERLDKEAKFLEKTIKEGQRFQISEGDTISIPLDVADAQALIIRIQNWSATPPAFLVKIMRKLTGSVSAELTPAPPYFKISVKVATKGG